MIVGGAGHTTEDLRQAMGREVPEIQTAGRPEAEIFQAYLEYRYGRKADLLERESTNCGNNITYLLKLLKSSRVPYQRIILTQDAAMQRRMDATLRKYAGEEIAIINYAAYQAKVVERDSKLAFDREIWGMWPMERYLTLLMGEISRLSDTPEGYGPVRKGLYRPCGDPRGSGDGFYPTEKGISGNGTGSESIIRLCRSAALLEAGFPLKSD